MTTRASGRRSALFAADRRGATIGIVALVTFATFEDLGVNTAMPQIAADLHAGAEYSWPFLAFLAASVVASVFAGRLCDRYGPVPAMLAGPAVFVVGLVVSGTAGAMPALLAGRTLQGFGAGTQVVAVTVLIAAVYPATDRPAAYAALSTACVVPALLGPTASGLVVQHAGWRYVFLGLVPLVLAGIAVLVPALRRLPKHLPDDPVTVRRWLPLAALAAAASVVVLEFGAQHPSPLTVVAGLVALAVLVPSVRRLLPTGTLTARAGLPTAVLSRGLLSGAYFAVAAYVPLTLTAVHGYSPAAAGLPLTVGALGWCAAAAWQGRRREISRRVLLRTGFVLVAAGLAATALAAPEWGPSWLVLATLAVAGAGLGLGASAASVLTLGLSTITDRGFNSAAMQISDLLGQVVLIGAGGVLITALAPAAHPSGGVAALDLVMAAVALLGALATGRRNDSPGGLTRSRRLARWVRPVARARTDALRRSYPAAVVTTPDPPGPGQHAGAGPEASRPVAEA
ncbi:MFS transporter [Actinocatenispora sera]|uniref:MFS transporter n=1 Tax=Actinocatenispora sera TaxID=390989 RepID=UPI0033F070B4